MPLIGLRGGESHDREVVRLRPARREQHLPRLGMHQPRHRSASLFEGLARGGAGRVQRRRVAPEDRAVQVREHGFEDLVVQRGGGCVI